MENKSNVLDQMDSNLFIHRVKELLKTKKRAQALDFVNKKFDDLFFNSCFDEASVIICDIILHKFPLSIALSVLTISFIWKENIVEARKELSKYTEELAFKIGGENKVNQIKRFL